MPYLDKTNYYERPRKKRGGDVNRNVFKHRIYASPRWRELRLQYLASNPLCERCERMGVVTPAEDVHHRESFADHLDNWRAYAYSYNNLMSLCKKCHGIIHANEQKGIYEEDV